MLLAGDIGGTKTTLAVFTGDDGLKSPVLEKTFPRPGLLAPGGHP